MLRIIDKDVKPGQDYTRYVGFWRNHRGEKAYDTKLKKKAEKLDWSCVIVATIWLQVCCCCFDSQMDNLGSW
jgi:hypothetical protein